MLRMAGAALHLPDAGLPPMETATAADVVSHGLVAVHAQPRLPFTISTVVAFPTILLEFGMTGDDLSRHQQ